MALRNNQLINIRDRFWCGFRHIHEILSNAILKLFSDVKRIYNRFWFFCKENRVNQMLTPDGQELSSDKSRTYPPSLPQ
jgi:hypothetical protein